MITEAHREKLAEFVADMAAMATVPRLARVIRRRSEVASEVAGIVRPVAQVIGVADGESAAVDSARQVLRPGRGVMLDFQAAPGIAVERFLYSWCEGDIESAPGAFVILALSSEDKAGAHIGQWTGMYCDLTRP